MNIVDYEHIAGYKPVPGQPCPSCKQICGPGGPDHTTVCAIVSKLWTEHKNNGAAIPARPTELAGNPDFQHWAANMASGLFRERVPHKAVVAVPDPPIAPTTAVN
jgi:hypothetical protein